MLLALFCKQNIKHKHTHTQHSLTHSCLPLPTHSLPFQQTIYLFQQIENEVFRCFQLVYLFFSFFTSIVRECVCVCVSLSHTHRHTTHTDKHTLTLTRILERGEKEEESIECTVSQYSGIYPAAWSRRSVFPSAFCATTTFSERERKRRRTGHTPSPPRPTFLPYKDTLAALEAAAHRGMRERGGGETRLSQE